MSAYMTRAQEKKLLDTYKLHNMRRFHSMNAAVAMDGYSVEFYSYYAHCLSWFPDGRMLLVYPIVADKSNYVQSPTTTRQVNRFLKELVSPRLSVSALQFGFDASETHVWHDSEMHEWYEIDGIDVRYIEHSDTLEKCL